MVESDSMLAYDLNKWLLSHLRLSTPHLLQEDRRYDACVYVKPPEQIPSYILNFFKVDPKTGVPLSGGLKVLLAQVLLHELEEGLRLLRRLGHQDIANQIQEMQGHYHLLTILENLRYHLQGAKGKNTQVEWILMGTKIRHNQMGVIEQKFGPYHLIGVTDLGVRYKSCNQDAMLVMPEQRVVAMADGIGGLAAGETASCVAIDFFEYALSRGHTIGQGFVYANDAVLYRSRKLYLDGPIATMGASFLAARLQENQIQFAHVGDVKAMVVRQGKLLKATNDHTHGQDLLQSHLVDFVTARDLNHILTRTLGIDHLCAHRDVEITEVALEPGDRVLLATDGVTTNFYDLYFQLDELVELIAQGNPVATVENIWRQTQRRMKSGVLPHGLRAKPDNFSLLLIEYQP